MTPSLKSQASPVGRNLYTDGAYLDKNPLWHTDGSPFKVQQILRMLARMESKPTTICEVGCGAGEVLRLLQREVDGGCSFCGYDISPQAIEMCQSRADEKLQFKLMDIGLDQDAHFDLMLVLDVVEHIEDYFGFLAAIRSKSDFKIFTFHWILAFRPSSGNGAY
jgi:2-polyprenyl-3-methyl-5-hydroxy-6-metoxy-1,4-benzoquinol methylase